MDYYVGRPQHGDMTEAHVEKVEKMYIGAAPDSSPTLDADTALARCLRHVIESKRRLQLQGIRSSTGLVSIELEEIVSSQ